MKLKKLISNKSHWTINKHLAKEIGLEATLVLQHLIDWSEYHNKETIFQTYAQISEELNISEHSIKKICIPKLKQLGFISIERKGIGYKNYYTIHSYAIGDFLTHPASEVKNTSPSEVSMNPPMSEVNTTPLKGENNLTSEVNTTSLMGENNTANSNNIISKNNKQKNINKKETVTNSNPIVTEEIFDKTFNEFF